MKRSRMVALAAVSAAFCALFLTLGAYVPVVDISCYLFSSVALMIPLAKKSYLGAFLAFVAGGLLALLFSVGNFFSVLPFVFFFGLHPIVNAFFAKIRFNRYAALAIKAVWFDGSVYVMYRFLATFTVSIAVVDQNIHWFILSLGTVFFVAYDYIMLRMQSLVGQVLDRILK